MQPGSGLGPDQPRAYSPHSYKDDGFCQDCLPYTSMTCSDWPDGENDCQSLCETIANRFFVGFNIGPTGCQCLFISGNAPAIEGDHASGWSIVSDSNSNGLPETGLFKIKYSGVYSDSDFSNNCIGYAGDGNLHCKSL